MLRAEPRGAEPRVAVTNKTHAAGTTSRGRAGSESRCLAAIVIPPLWSKKSVLRSRHSLAVVVLSALPAFLLRSLDRTRRIYSRRRGADRPPTFGNDRCCTIPHRNRLKREVFRPPDRRRRLSEIRASFWRSFVSGAWRGRIRENCAVAASSLETPSTSAGDC